jgi:hypothetical protein
MKTVMYIGIWFPQMVPMENRAHLREPNPFPFSWQIDSIALNPIRLWQEKYT